MSEATLEERVAQLERQVAELMDQRINSHWKASAQEPGPDDWENTIGMFRGDPIMKEICDEALRLRNEERQQFHERDQASPE